MNYLDKIALLFSGWNETLIWSVLQGHMGYAMANHPETPTAAQVVVGDFCFLAGKPSASFAAKAAAREIVPQNEEWSEAIEQAFGSRAQRRLRYAIRKEPDVFSHEKLQGLLIRCQRSLIFACLTRTSAAGASRRIGRVIFAAVLRTSKIFSPAGSVLPFCTAACLCPAPAVIASMTAGSKSRSTPSRSTEGRVWQPSAPQS